MPAPLIIRYSVETHAAMGAVYKVTPLCDERAVLEAVAAWLENHVDDRELADELRAAVTQPRDTQDA